MAIPEVLTNVLSAMMTDGVKVAVLIVTARYVVFGVKSLRKTTPKKFNWATASERMKRRRYYGRW